jgi:hypothetical protein
MKTHDTFTRFYTRDTPSLALTIRTSELEEESLEWNCVYSH